MSEEKSPILYCVDDNELDANIFKLIWNRVSDVEVQHVASGSDLIRLLENSHTDEEASPCAVFLDLNMPEMNGFEVLEHVRRDPAFRKIPILVLSTSSQQDDIQKAFESQANAYLVKRSRMDEYEDSLKAAHDFWLRWNVSSACVD